jgi:hypothetical protein
MGGAADIDGANESQCDRGGAHEVVWIKFDDGPEARSRGGRCVLICDRKYG